MKKNFMNGKNGVDEYSVFLNWVSIFLLIISFLVKKRIWATLAMVIIIFSYYRVFSSNIIKRNSENYKFLITIWNPLKKHLKKFKRQTIGDKDHKYIHCPKCKQELRIPKNKGKIKIKCPKCGEKFNVRS